MADNPRYVAIHEAGHVVGSHITQRALGRHWNQFDRVFVRSRREAKTPYIDHRARANECIGMVEGPSRYNPFGCPVWDVSFGDNIDGEQVIEQWRVDMEADVLGILAGPLAEARYRRISKSEALLWGGKDDYRRCEIIAREFCHSQAELDSLLNSLQRRAEKLVGDPINWRAINALADALLVERSLTAKEAVEIIVAAGLDPLPPPPIDYDDMT